MEWIITVVALSVVIFVHELGHFLLAKLAGIAVPEFSIGMGPKLMIKRMGGTDYVLRLLPVGGFVKLGGLDEDVVVADSENYHFKSFFQRLCTLLAGSAFNVVFGFVLFVMVAVVVGERNTRPLVAGVMPGSPAALAGILPGDTLLEVNHMPVVKVRQLIRDIRRSGGKSLHVDYRRGETVYSVDIVPKGKTPQIGVEFRTDYEPVSFFGAIGVGFNQTWRQIVLFGLTLKMMFAGDVQLKDLMGPVGIMQMASTGFQHGMVTFVEIMGMISISLGLANTLPIPMLDGGHVLFLIVEKIRGKRLASRTEGLIINLGAAFLIGLMLIIIGNDIFRWQERLALLKGLK